MNFPEMEKLHSDLEVMEICQVPQAVIYPKEFGTKKDIVDFQDSVFYLSADAPVEYSRANLEQICVQKEFIPKTKVVPNHATLLSLMDREDSAAIMDLWKHRFRSLERSEKTVPMQKSSGCCMRRWRNATGRKS